MRLPIYMLISATALSVNSAEPVPIVLHTNKVGSPVQPTMYGIFFEDINYGADGGLYAEMVKNRSFEFPDNLMGWNSFGRVTVNDDGPFENNPHYVTLSSAGHQEKHTGIENEGYFGMSFVKDADYKFSVWARSRGNARLEIQLVDPAADNESVTVAKGFIEVSCPQWTKYSLVLRSERNVSDGTLRVFLPKPDTTAVDVEHISLFPTDTWNGHENGLRKDIAQALADLHPGVFRFPGGCIVEGTELPDRYQWKNTVGPVENRPTIPNRWQYTFKHRFAPDYYQSNGLGFYEYFLLSEEIGAEPLPVLNVGMVCQYQNGNQSAHVAVDSLDCYIQDAIDLVEFANGPDTSPWGKIRTEMGHPASFGLKYIAIGNEQWGPEYVERLAPFVCAMRKACPEIKIVGSSGPSPSGDKFDYLWPEMKKLGVDLVDEHFYSNEDWFRNNATRYDSYPRKGPKVFAGEYACHMSGRKRNLYEAALNEAAFMTGMERNADVVFMSTYAPLLANKKGWQWRPDMIWFDNDGINLTSSYYIQKLFSTNTGDYVISLTGANGKPLTGADGLYASAAWDKDSYTYIVKIVNLSDTKQSVDLELNGLKKSATIMDVSITSLTAETDDKDCDTVNIESAFLRSHEGRNFEYELPSQSVNIFRFSKK